MNKPHDRIESEFENLRSMEAPSGPSAEVVARTLAALDKSESQPGWRILIMRNRNPIAAALLIGISGVIAWLFLHAPAISCAGVIEKMGSAHLMQYEEVITFQVTKTYTIRHVDTDSGVAYQFLPDGQIDMQVARDGEANISLLPSTKLANVTLNAAPDTPQFTLLDEFRAMIQAPSRDLGPAQIDGHQSEEFHVERDGPPIIGMASSSLQRSHETYNLFIDRQSGDLVRVEKGISSPGLTENTVYRNFVANPDIPGVDWSRTVPADYTQHIYGSALMTPDQYQTLMVQYLYDYAAAHNGRYPTDASGFPKGAVYKGKRSEFEAAMHLGPEPEITATAMMLLPATPTNQPPRFGLGALAQPSTRPLPNPSLYVVQPWEYFGGKSASDKTSVILCFKGVHSFIGIYGDLSVKNLKSPPQD